MELLIDQSNFEVPIYVGNHDIFYHWIEKLKILLNWNNTEYEKKDINQLKNDVLKAKL